MSESISAEESESNEAKLSEQEKKKKPNNKTPINTDMKANPRLFDFLNLFYRKQLTASGFVSKSSLIELAFSAFFSPLHTKTAFFIPIL